MKNITINFVQKIMNMTRFVPVIFLYVSVLQNITISWITMYPLLWCWNELQKPCALFHLYEYVLKQLPFFFQNHFTCSFHVRLYLYMYWNKFMKKKLDLTRFIAVIFLYVNMYHNITNIMSYYVLSSAVLKRFTKIIRFIQFFSTNLFCTL